MSIKIDLGMWNSVFAVPSKVVDEGLKFSDGVKLKVLLYVLRNSGNEIDDKDISKATGVNVTDIPEALDYWVSMGVLYRSGNTITPQNEESFDSEVPAEAEDVTVDDTPQQKESESEIMPKQTILPKPQRPDYVTTAQKLSQDEELKFLVNELQIVLNKTITSTDASSLIMLKDTCGLPVEVILMLAQYCVSIDHGNMRTIEKIGVQWADQGIYTLEAADNKIKQTRETSKRYSIISKVFGLKNVGSPTKKQLAYADKWIGEWKFSPEMLREAYERCVDSKGSMKLAYIDGILKRWYESGIKSVEDIDKADAAPKNTAPKRKTSYDINKLKKIDMLDDY